MDNVKEFRSLESRLEWSENALIAGGLLQAPPMPILESPEMVPFTLVDKPVLHHLASLATLKLVGFNTAMGKINAIASISLV